MYFIKCNWRYILWKYKCYLSDRLNVAQDCLASALVSPPIGLFVNTSGAGLCSVSLLASSFPAQADQNLIIISIKCFLACRLTAEDLKILQEKRFYCKAL